MAGKALASSVGKNPWGLNFSKGSSSDAGASSASTRGRTTQHLRDQSGVSNASQYCKSFEEDRKQKRKDHTRGDKMSTCDLGA
jgi:hypothetical protein